jgi:hypothetical protein
VKKRGLPDSKRHPAEHPAGDTPADVDEDLATPDWEIALAEVAQRHPLLDTDHYPSPLPVTVTALMRHLLDLGPGQLFSSGGDADAGKAALAGGIEGGLRRMARVERSEIMGLLKGEVEALLFVKETWGGVLERAIEPLVRQETTWRDRPWPTKTKDQVALFGEYLSKDPDVVQAVIAAVAIGMRDPRKREGSNQYLRRLDQVERLLGEYFERRGRNSYCDFVHATATACFSPGFRIVASRLLDVATRSLTAEQAAASAHAHELAALDREHRQALAGKRVDVMALCREKEQAVAAARLDGMASAAERVRSLETRVRELEGQLDTVRRRASREKAFFAQQLAATTSESTPESAPLPPSSGVAAATARGEGTVAPATLPAMVTPAETSQRRPLEGRRVFLYTNKKRGAVREAFVAELEELGASDPRVYETKGGSVPGPTAFPPRSVVIVDTTFMSHTFSNVIRRRARAAHETLFVEDRFGVGGLAQRLAGVSERQAD